MMKQEPFVSVILDNYNYESFLAEAIESVLQQTYQNFEIIIVDDGSSDNSREIIQNYSERYDNIISIFKENGGQTSAFNAGYAAASGDIVAFLDSDDYWLPKKLETVVSYHQKYQIVQHYLTCDGKKPYRRVRDDVNWHNVLVQYGYLYNHSVCSSLSFSKNLLDKIFPLIDPQEMRYCTDGVVLMACLSIEPIGIVNTILGYYRIHGNNLYIKNTDRGEIARKILSEQHIYVNKQLKSKGYLPVQFDNTHYFDVLIEKKLKERLLKYSDRCIIYGTEVSGRNITLSLEKKNLMICGYADSDSQKWGKTFLEKIIFSPLDLVKRRSEFDKIIIASSASYEICNLLVFLGFQENVEIIVLPI